MVDFKQVNVRWVVTKKRIYKQYITMKKYWIVAFCLLFILAIVILLIMRRKLFKRYLRVMVFTRLLTEFSLIFITVVA